MRERQREGGEKRGKRKGEGGGVKIRRGGKKRRGRRRGGEVTNGGGGGMEEGGRNYITSDGSFALGKDPVQRGGPANSPISKSQVVQDRHAAIWCLTFQTALI